LFKLLNFKKLKKFDKMQVVNPFAAGIDVGSRSHVVNGLRLAPNNKIMGSKKISSRTSEGKNHFSLALRNAANTIENSKDGFLLMFFRRIAYKKGRTAAITATARKLAVIIWNMIMKNRNIPTSIPKNIKKK